VERHPAGLAGAVAVGGRCAHHARFALPVRVAGADAISTSMRAAAEATTSDLFMNFLQRWN
jgi:hypothetical protein